MNKPLSEILRPKDFKEVIGQDHLVGQNGFMTKMYRNKTLMSVIIHGTTGTGKTTIANVFGNKMIEKYPDEFDFKSFNSSTDGKDMLKKAIGTNENKTTILLVDEIHRMKKDTQDYLLPYIESGKVKIIGLTTVNPYFSVNEAIKSRCVIFKTNEIKNDELENYINSKIQTISKDIKYDKKIVKMIVNYSQKDIRRSINILESLLIMNNKEITEENLKIVLGKNNLNIDNHELYLNDLISAMQKSIRGSDVDASLHYLARIIQMEDLEQLLRRLIVITYEDVGLAYPEIQNRMLNTIEAVKIIGLPEARILLSNLVIELAILPKSNSAYLAIDKALSEVEQNNITKMPDHVKNSKIKLNPSIYKYPHKDKDALNEQRYIPLHFNKSIYYKPKDNSNYERNLKKQLEKIDQIKNVKREE